MKKGGGGGGMRAQASSVGGCDDWCSPNFHLKMMTESSYAAVNELFICAQITLLMKICHDLRSKIHSLPYTYHMFTFIIPTQSNDKGNGSDRIIGCS